MIKASWLGRSKSLWSLGLKSIIFSMTHYEHLQHNFLSYFVYSQINAAPTWPPWWNRNVLIFEHAFHFTYTLSWSSALVVFYILLYLSHQESSPVIAQFGWTAMSRKSSGHPKLLLFQDNGSHCALSNHECFKKSFVLLATTVPCHNSISELLGQFLLPHHSNLLWYAVRTYVDRCVLLQVQSF